MLPGCTATSLVSFWSGVIPSGRHESGTAGANFQKVGRGSLSKPCFYKLSRWHRSTFRMWILYHEQHQHPKGSRGRYSKWRRFQVTGMIKWGQKSKPRNSCIKKKIPGSKINPQKSHAEFPGLKNFQKVLNDTCTLYNMTCSTLFGCTYSQNYAASTWG